jgi:rhamnosyltransferase
MDAGGDGSYKKKVVYFKKYKLARYIMVETSIILRIKNEEKWLKECLARIFDQTYKNFEVVIVDSGSIDKSLEIARKFPVKILTIKPEEFSYPVALNFGCRNSLAEKYFVFLSGHSLPISKTWLEDGIKAFDSEKIIGVYGNIWPLPDASFWEKIFFNKRMQFFIGAFQKNVINKKGLGVLGFTNAIIRRDLWEKYNFDENYGMGGEDTAWADYWFQKGFYAFKTSKFSVYHSHGLGLVGLYEQLKYWKSTSNPEPFRPISFRKNK